MSSGVGMASGLQQDLASDQELSLVTSSCFAPKAISLHSSLLNRAGQQEEAPDASWNR